MFDPDAPVFRTDEEYDRAGLPLPIELSVSFSAVGAPAPADAELADYLLKTKAVCEFDGMRKVTAIYMVKSKPGLAKIVRFVLIDQVD